jgi:lipopolysaccharide export LptBFGC system permease protein LptF
MAMAILLIAGNFTLNASAQTHIEALVKKCESMESVDMNVIRNRNRETKKLERSITTVIIKDNEALVNEFIAAFKADEGDVIQVIENKSSGKLMPSQYIFEGVHYHFFMKDKANATVSEIITSRKKRDLSYVNEELLKLDMQKIEFDAQKMARDLEQNTLK